MNKVVLAVGAHPDDIEFSSAGTLLQLREKGWEIRIQVSSRSGNRGPTLAGSSKFGPDRGCDHAPTTSFLSFAPLENALQDEIIRSFAE